jgi:hypothetical protein
MIEIYANLSAHFSLQTLEGFPLKPHFLIQRRIGTFMVLTVQYQYGIDSYLNQSLIIENGHLKYSPQLLL